ncbi:MAG: hypothetical protein K9N09_08590 [Candidatus Cloacimonetes bacterium]|nr:hypothetical protein [Candidatus Cloacimonadota bacterium]MCF7814159.1 hypothetical protein [Candidatus Cloacimonadota bacterium]MCF7868742.1 hypothetical protein [Candidatus Cloacimonadota bacterium]MCF7884158.1 hypothetical protein [Candidatus Cloacimonadota bacterium]
MKSFKYLLILLVLSAAALLFITSCDDRTMEPETFFITNMSVNPDTIYADNGITYSEVAVTVKNEDNFAVTGQEVNFRSSIGNVLYSVLTDSTGIAHSTFWDDGNIGTATIDAFAGDVSASKDVVVIETPPIETINLDAPLDVIVGKVNLIKASVLNNFGPVPNNTIVVFDTDHGYFQTADGTDLGSTTQAQTSNGIAKVYFNSGTQSGLATITCSVSNVQEVAEVPVLPGNPNNMTLNADPVLIHVNANESSNITATVKDVYGNPVLPGTLVTFESTIGTVNPSDATDEYGHANTTFSPGVQAGLAEITATADSASATTQVTVISDQVYSLAYAFSGQIDINLLGTGGNESVEIVVNLYDSNGNLIDDNDDLEVYFKFITAPIPGIGDIGANLNNTVFYPSTDSVSVQPENGQAVVSVSSGTNPGTVGLKAYTYNASNSMISASKSNIVVHSGPPNSIELTIGDVDSGENMGGGMWQIQCAAIINDAWGNPVDYGTAVWFSLEDAEFPGTDPDWAAIGAEAYVGNENTSGDSLDGVAYTYMNYEGNHTNDSLVVWVEVSGPTSTFTDSTVVIMPIQFAQIDIVATPSHVDWTATNNPEYQYTLVQILVTDEQNNPINGQPVYITSTPGVPVAGPNSTTPSFIGYTGNVNGIQGMLHKSILFYKYECPAPGLVPPGTTDAVIVATLLGTGISGDITVTLNRYVP